MMKFATVTLLGLFSTTYGATQTITCAANSNCRVEGNQTVIVIAPKSVKSLIIDCLGDSTCKKNGGNPGLTVYSSANDTTINCDGENTCEEINVYLGKTPPGGNALEHGGLRNLAIVNCPIKCSCKKINIETSGKLDKGLNVLLPTTGVNGGAFSQGNIVCNDAETTCTTQCGNVNDMCKDSKCLGSGTCVCTGNACESDFNTAPTAKPTSIPTVPAAPTERPTPAPVAPRNITVCSTGNCVLEPSNNWDVDCSKSAQKCRIECIGDSKCQNGVIITADSKEVELICEGKNACDKVHLVNTEKSSITIKVTDEAGAGNMKLIIENKLTTLYVDVMGIDGFANGQVFCDGALCEIMCMGPNACKTALFECLTNSDKCKCKSMDDTCPEISYFGDANCDGVVGKCTLTPNGNTRLVLPNTVNDVEINCLDEAQCKFNGKGLRVFTAAKTTTINCKNKDTCEGISIKGGSLSGSELPKGFKANDFTEPSSLGPQTLTINCDNEDSCKSLSLFTTGGIETTLIGDGEDALAHADLECSQCAKLDLSCREFRGCPFATLSCTPLNRCQCDSIHVFVNLTEVTTSEPRNSCPEPVLLRQQSVAVNNNLNNNVNNNTQTFLIPVTIIGLLVVVCMVVVMYNYKKQYKTIPDDKATKLQNSHNIASYQVEMQ